MFKILIDFVAETISPLSSKPSLENLNKYTSLGIASIIKFPFSSVLNILLVS